MQEANKPYLTGSGAASESASGAPSPETADTRDFDLIAYAREHRYRVRNLHDGYPVSPARRTKQEDPPSTEPSSRKHCHRMSMASASWLDRISPATPRRISARRQAGVVRLGILVPGNTARRSVLLVAGGDRRHPVYR